MGKWLLIDYLESFVLSEVDSSRFPEAYRNFFKFIKGDKRFGYVSITVCLQSVLKSTMQKKQESQAFE